MYHSWIKTIKEVLLESVMKAFAQSIICFVEIAVILSKLMLRRRLNLWFPTSVDSIKHCPHPTLGYTADSSVSFTLYVFKVKTEYIEQIPRQLNWGWFDKELLAMYCGKPFYTFLLTKMCFMLQIFFFVMWEKCSLNIQTNLAIWRRKLFPATLANATAWRWNHANLRF